FIVAVYLLRDRNAIFGRLWLLRDNRHLRNTILLEFDIDWIRRVIEAGTIVRVDTDPDDATEQDVAGYASDSTAADFRVNENGLGFDTRPCWRQPGKCPDEEP
ncbi:hypothetical protein VQ044_25365, partial [Aurantimonas sp. C2-5-R2]|uniref:hypothetical protein n=1 Tax=Aurantimonas sp. C2-5-R2 TaxID=3113713 RepID=UPI002F93E5F5